MSCKPDGPTSYDAARRLPAKVLRFPGAAMTEDEEAGGRRSGRRGQPPRGCARRRGKEASGRARCQSCGRLGRDCPLAETDWFVATRTGSRQVSLIGAGPGHDHAGAYAGNTNDMPSFYSEAPRVRRARRESFLTLLQRLRAEAVPMRSGRKRRRGMRDVFAPVLAMLRGQG